MKSPFNFNKKLINQAELARKLNISSPYLCLILNGKRKSAKYEKQILDFVKNEFKSA